MPDRRACNRSKWAKIPQISGMACHSAEFSHGLQDIRDSDFTPKIEEF